MPSPFDVTTVSNTVTLDNNRTGVASFTVKNNARRRVHATAKLSIALADDKQPIPAVPADAPKWLSILPPPAGTIDTADVRDFAIDGTQSYQVRVAVPMDAPAASYKFKLTVADELNPDDNFADSPDVLFTVRDLPKPAPRSFPFWIIPAIIIVVIVVVAIIAILVVNNNNTQHGHQTETAAVNVQTQTAAAALTAVALQTQAVLFPFLGVWNPLGTTDPITGLRIDDAGSGQVTVNVNLISSCAPTDIRCLPNLNTGLPKSFKFGPVPIVGGQINRAVGNGVFMVIQVRAQDQLVVSLNGGGFDVVQLFNRTESPAAASADFSQAESVPSSSLSDAQVRDLEALAAATATPES